MAVVVTASVPHENETHGEPPSLRASDSRRALAAFFLFGILMSALGAFLPAWGYHLDEHLTTAGNFFLSLNLGMLIAVRVATRLLPKHGVRFTMVTSAASASLAFFWLALVPAPQSPFLLAAGLLLLGFSAGLLNAGAFHAISPLYSHDRAATTTLAGTLYGLGCLITVLLVAGAYYVYSFQVILLLFTLIPLLFIAVFLRGNFLIASLAYNIPLRRILVDFQNPGAVLFALILFFQFGNEWSIAGWLPIFLIRRLGISPATSLFMLAFYWASLLVGRVLAKSMLKSVNHGKLLLGSIVLALFGCIVLTFTTNSFGALTGILFVGAGFAAIYPLVVERIAHRFTYYHPGLYNGIFSFAVTGGLIAPFLLGYLAQWQGVGVIMMAPMLGTFLVFLLVLLIVLETNLSGDRKV